MKHKLDLKVQKRRPFFCTPFPLNSILKKNISTRKEIKYQQKSAKKKTVKHTSQMIVIGGDPFKSVVKNDKMGKPARRQSAYSPPHALKYWNKIET